jgi:DNA-binding IclR family transcriptional regulator
MSLECIAQETEDSVYLVMRSGFDALCVEHIDTKLPIRIMAYNIGSRRPLGIGSASLALLSFSRDDEIETILEANKLWCKKHNNMTVQKLRSLINLARKFGYVFNEGNYMKGVNGVGVPIYNHQGNVVAAISVAAISERIDQARSKKIARLIKSEIVLVR